MTKSVPNKEISRREFLKNTAKIALGAAALSAVSVTPQTTAKAASLPVKRSTRNVAVNFDPSLVWDG